MPFHDLTLIVPMNLQFLFQFMLLHLLSLLVESQQALNNQINSVMHSEM
jgi:hypothetical protein